LVREVLSCAGRWLDEVYDELSTTPPGPPEPPSPAPQDDEDGEPV